MQTTAQLLKAIHRHGGLIRPSFGERVLFGLYAAGAIAVAIALVAVSFQKLARHESDYLVIAAFGAVVPVVCLVFTLALVRRCFLTVRFSESTVTCYGLFGSRIWSESLEGLEEMKHMPGFRGPGSFKLIWPHQVRTVPFDSWWQQLLMQENMRLARRAFRERERQL